jgi:hypothetical protein
MRRAAELVLILRLSKAEADKGSAEQPPYIPPKPPYIPPKPPYIPPKPPYIPPKPPYIPPNRRDLARPCRTIRMKRSEMGRVKRGHAQKIML